MTNNFKPAKAGSRETDKIIQRGVCGKEESRKRRGLSDG